MKYQEFSWKDVTIIIDSYVTVNVNKTYESHYPIER